MHEHLDDKKPIRPLEADAHTKKRKCAAMIVPHETVTDSVLVITAEPGEGVPFSHTFGLRAQVDFDVRWSEPRDTTLLLWVGLAVGRTIEEACQPVFGG